MSSGLDAIPNINHCQQLVLSYAILNHIVLHSALHKDCSSTPSVVPGNRLCDSKLNVQHLITLILVEKN